MNYVCGFAFSENHERVLLIEKKRPEWQAGRLNGIGGKCEDGERRPRETMVREFREETGVETTAGEWILFAEILSPVDKHRVVFFFTVLDYERFDSAKTMTDEKVTWQYTEAMTNVVPNLNWLIALAASWNHMYPDGYSRQIDHVVIMEKSKRSEDGGVKSE